MENKGLAREFYVALIEATQMCVKLGVTKEQMCKTYDYVVEMGDTVDTEVTHTLPTFEEREQIRQMLGDEISHEPPRWEIYVERLAPYLNGGVTTITSKAVRAILGIDEHETKPSILKDMGRAMRSYGFSYGTHCGRGVYKINS